MAEASKTHASRITTEKNGLHSKIKRNLRNTTSMIERATSAGLNNRIVATDAPNSSITKPEISIGMMLSEVRASTTEEDSREKTEITFRSLTEATITINEATTTDSMLQNRTGTQAGKGPLRISSSTPRAILEVHLEAGSIKGVTIEGSKCSVTLTNFMMVAIKRTRDLILKRLEAMLLTSNRLATSKIDL